MSPHDPGPLSDRPSDSHEAALERILLRACVLELAGRDRHVLELRLFHDWTPEEIAAFVGIPPADVPPLLARLTERLAHRRGEVTPDAVEVDLEALYVDAVGSLSTGGVGHAP